MTYHSATYKTIDDVPSFTYQRVRYTIEHTKMALLKMYHNNPTKMQRGYAFFCISYLTGARISEILAMKLKDIILHEDTDGKIWVELCIHTLKNRKNKTRIIPLLVGVEAWASKPFIEYYIWSTKHNENNPEQILFDFTRQQGNHLCSKMLGFNHHFLRKIRATQQWRYYKLSPKTLQKFLGHSSLEAIEPYLSITSEDIKQQVVIAQDLMNRL